MSVPVSNTCGWDAVCAYDAASINALFLQQFLQDTSTGTQCLVNILVSTGEENGVIALELVLGPPMIQIEESQTEQTCTVTIPILSGTVVFFQSGYNQVQEVFYIQPNTSCLTGPIILSTTTGDVNSAGTVILTLQNGTYSPSINGIESSSQLSTAIGLAIQTFFQNSPVTYTLGNIGIPNNLSLALTPTSFEFNLQPNPAVPNDGALLLMIQTNGKPGQLAPLPTYPLQNGSQAVLIISNNVVFNTVLPAGIISAMNTANIDVTASGIELDGYYYAAQITQGTANIGSIGNYSMDTPYSGDGLCNQVSIDMDMTGLQLAPDGSGNMTAAWTYSWSQLWNSFDYPNNCLSNSTPLVANYSFSTPLSVSTSAVVSMDTPTPVIGLTQTPSVGFWGELIGEVNVVGDFTSQFQSAISTAFNAITLPDVDGFALGSILFPQDNILVYTGATVPCDLQLAANIVAPWAVTPETVTIQPGGTVQFAAPGTSVWSILSGSEYATIDSATGLLTANTASGNQVQDVVVGSVSDADTSLAAYALVTIAPPAPTTGLQVFPQQSIVGALGFCELSVELAGGGNPLGVTCTLSPATNSGQMEPGMTGWSYTPPENVSQCMTVTATFTDDSGNEGIAEIVVVTYDSLSITLSPDTAGPGGTISATANTVNENNISWSIYPTNAGSIAVSGFSTSNATITLASNVQPGSSVTIAAIALPPSVQQTPVAMGCVTFNVASS